MVTEAQIADLEANILFAKKLLIEFKQKNIDEGMSPSQALWLHHRARAWTCVYDGVTFTVDIMNMAASGDIQTVCLSLMFGQPDDMSEPYHWLSDARRLYLIDKIKLFLGWS